MHFSLIQIFLVISLIAVCCLPLVHLQYSSGKFLGKYPVPKETRSPINIISKRVHKVDLKPFSLHATLSDKVKVINDGKLVKVILTEDSTTSSVTGGVLGDNIYNFKMIKYIWTDNTNGTAGITIDGKGYPLNNGAIFQNIKYKTFEEALHKRDGLAIVIFYIGICSTANKIFEKKYAGELKEIQNAGSVVETTLGTAIKWFAGNGVIPPNAPYYAYPSSYHDENNKEYFCSTLIVLPHLPKWCLSEKQYKETFGSFKNSLGKPLITKERQYPMSMPVVQAKGILNSNTP